MGQEGVGASCGARGAPRARVAGGSVRWGAPVSAVGSLQWGGGVWGGGSAADGIGSYGVKGLLE